MKKGTILASFVGAMLALCLISLPAHAQATRTWVSGVGDDVNPCSRTAPCKTFAGAISKTATNGEINCLDSGGFGTVTITKSISIICEGVIGGVLAANTNGINITNLPAGGIVYLKGLDIEGVTTGLVGISFNSTSSGILHVENCLVRGFNTGNATGISFTPNGLSELYVTNSFITDNGAGATGGGISIRPTVAAGVNAVLSEIHVLNNAQGVKADGTGGTGTSNLTLVDSVVGGNTNSNVLGVATTGNVKVMINRASLSASLVGLRSDGATSTIRIGDSVIFGNITGVQTAGGGVLQSYGNNQLNGNTTDGSMPTTPLR